jgi:signal transduction histidine kinase
LSDSDKIKEKQAELQKKADALEATLAEARHRIAALQVVHEVAQSLTSELNLEPLLHEIVSSAVLVMNASAGSLLLLDELTEELVFEVVEGGAGSQLKGVRISREKGVVGWVATHRKPLIIDDVNKDDRYYQSIAQSFDLKLTSLLCVPMISRNILIGVLEVLHNVPGKYFNTLDQQLLTTFANQAAIAIENARLVESLKRERDHIVEVEDEVRKRLARDLHDGPTQLLASLVMSLGYTKELLNRAPEHVPREIEESAVVADRALKQLRTLLFDLRPVILETQGLVPALEVYAERLQETEELNVQLTTKKKFGRLSAKAEVAIFAIVQEAINNARKYAGASRIEVVLEPNKREDSLTVMVRDDGKGFDVQTVTSTYDERGSLGIINSRERAESINGTFTIHSKPGSGTEVILRIPLQENLLIELKDDE